MKLETITATELFEMDIPPIGHIVENLFEEESLIYIGGPPGSFKTGFMLFLSLCLATKEECMGMKIPKPLNILFIDEENGLRRTKNKLRRLMLTMGIKKCDNIHFLSLKGFKINRVTGMLGIRELEEFIKEKSIDVVIIDSLARTFWGKEQDVTDVKKIHDLLKPILEKYHTTFFLLHHLKKGDKFLPKTLEDLRGSGDIGAQCDQAFLFDTTFANLEKGEMTFSVVNAKQKDDIGGGGFNFIVKGKPGTDELRVLFGGTIEDNVERAYNKCILEIKVLLEAEDMSTKQIKERVHSGKDTVSRCLKKLMDQGEITTYKKGNAIMYTPCGKSEAALL